MTDGVKDGLRYPVVIDRREYDGVVEYSAVVPDLPGCVAAGDSPEEALENVKTAIEGWIADATERGLHIPGPRSWSDREKEIERLRRERDSLLADLRIAVSYARRAVVPAEDMEAQYTFLRRMSRRLSEHGT